MKYFNLYLASLARSSFSLFAACRLSTFIYLMNADGLLCPDMRISSPAGKPDKYIFVQNDRRQV